jgi:hypothetical protein
MQINAPQEWIEEANELMDTSSRKIAKKLLEKYGNSVPFPMFLHVMLCQALHNVHSFAPSPEEAKKFVKQAIEEVEENFKERAL